MDERVCRTCGKTFMPQAARQEYCHDPCRPDRNKIVNRYRERFTMQTVPTSYAETDAKQDCLMCKDVGCGFMCTGLVRMFCAEQHGQCAFYKPRKNTDTEDASWG